MKLRLLSCALLCAMTTDALCQAFTNEEYAKAVWMTGRMYGGQRSGNHNWLLYNHLPDGVDEQYRGTAFIDDADGDYDLSGGWHDAGDHVKFGQTHFYAAYMLLKAYAEFPEGYDDLYSYDYHGYATAGDWTWEGGAGDPNGIPDILDEVKHATDYFIKCTPNSSTFYYRVGDGGPDHAKWVTATKMQTLPVNQGGNPRVALKNPNDASMSSFCGATLALMSRVYEKFDPAYAATCLEHAYHAYDYSKANPGTGGASSYYPSNNNWKDDYASMCAELYWATGSESYRTEALGFSTSSTSGNGADVYFNYSADYNNNGETALYNLAKLGHPDAADDLDDVVNNHYFNNTNGLGLYDGGNAWGPLRYNANSSLVVAFWQKLNGTENSPHQFIYDNLDYILGDNSLNFSFIVGFKTGGGTHAIHPHHRNYYLNDDNPGDSEKQSLVAPVKNQQFGLLVGGSRDPGSYTDNVTSYTSSEGGIDYNAGLVGALAFLRQALDPVDTAKFGNPTPALGDDISICGSSSLMLDANIDPDGVKTFTWYRNDQEVQSASSSANTYEANSAGTYKVVLDSLGEWQTQDVIEITGDIGVVELGDDIELCAPAYVVLDAGVSGSGLNIAWTKDGDAVDGNSATLTVKSAGTYAVEVSATGCSAKSDQVTITSLVPEVTDGIICDGEAATLVVHGDHSNYDWYGSEDGNDLLEEGTASFQTTSAGTYWVEDPSNQSYTTGPSMGDANFTDSDGNNGSGPVSYLEIEVLSAFTLDQVSFEVKSWSASTGILTITPLSGGSAETIGFDIPAGTNGSWEIVNAAIGYSFSPGLYSIECTAIRSWSDAGDDYYGTTYNELFTMSGNHSSFNEHYNPNHYAGYFDWMVTAGTGCARVPVEAEIASGPDCLVLVEESSSSQPSTEVYPNPSNGWLTVQGFSGEAQLELLDITGKSMWSETAFGGRVDLTLPQVPGIYMLKVADANGVDTFRVVRQ